MKRITGCQMGRYVTQKTEFDNSKKSAYARWLDNPERLYVVYSYGTHWPMYIFVESTHMWFGNSGRTSNTTSKHTGQARPHGVTDITWVSCQQMLEIAATGTYHAPQVKTETVLTMRGKRLCIEERIIK